MHQHFPALISALVHVTHNFSNLLDSSVLGSFANLEWLGDLSWNIGCIMISEHYCEVLNAFEGIPVTNSPQIIAAPTRTTKSQNRIEINSRAGLLVWPIYHKKSDFYSNYLLTMIHM